MSTAPCGAPWTRAILHVDMDAFYASVEVLDHPQWRGKPVIVGADPQGGRGRGVVSAASYEARRFGVHSAMPISKAWQLCPQGVFAVPRGERYQEMSDRVMEILGRYTPRLEPISVDEAFLDVTGSQRLHGAPPDIAAAIKAAVKGETRLTASVGVSASKLVAKIASDLEKPDGMVVVPPGTEAGFLAPLPVSRMWGVGPVAEKRLRAAGLATLGDLQRLPEEAARKLLGDHGAALWHLAWGRDHRPVDPEGVRRSLGREHTFDEDVTDPGVLGELLLELCDEIARRLRRAKLRGRTLTLKIRYRGFETHTRATTLGDPVVATEDLHPVARRIFEGIDRKGRPVRLLGLYVSHLTAEERVAPTLFPEHDRKVMALGESVDRIREKFGREAVTRGRLVGRRRSRGEPLPERRR